MKVYVSGMTCMHCKKTVERLFSQIDGVEKVEVDLATKIANIKSTKNISKEALEKSLEDTAYKVEKVEY
ncbi:MAG TPA: heavy-metal-associated domain-containing protein [Thermodesulfobium narugense]|uniref:Copper chaperone/Cu+-exporting ATPase n=1 Tax=Thermodesulfobium acidiphilum TaxID=1794699 RepID=A0A2R4VZ99_THEAF|nr:heavy metal-associated domain-containing protein [Thermodesulfobium acidiphilum]AWB09788.1 copper chaperone/Cu+-exporting ATPase [Thermodesulfobium acidiphilum]PMP85773.1 MAG: copper-binding protein [Thermodesulfobium narugense]HEM55980.1 heavy-metal-associated domain-containing protein [Thermodesulfobium narugense]